MLRMSPLQQRISPVRQYHSYEHKLEPVYNASEEAILSASMGHVPKHGFSPTSLALGARDAGYLDISTNLFPKGAFDLIKYHLVTQRLALKDRVELNNPAKGGKKLGVGAKVKLLTAERLMANQPVIGQWSGALAVMAQPTNARESIAELARLSDEIWFLAGDVSVDTSWYTKRASLSAIYASTELFMTQDTSTDFHATKDFLERRMQDVRGVGGTIGAIGEWVNFTGHAFTNVLRSKGVGI